MALTAIGLYREEGMVGGRREELITARSISSSSSFSLSLFFLRRLLNGLFSSPMEEEEGK